MAYIKACGPVYVVLGVLSFIIYTGCVIGLGTWLQFWSDDSYKNEHTLTFWLLGYSFFAFMRSEYIINVDCNICIFVAFLNV